MAKEKPKTEDGTSMFERADKLADALIETFGFIDSQLVASMTLGQIQKKLCDAKLDGEEANGFDVDS